VREAKPAACTPRMAAERALTLDQPLSLRSMGYYAPLLLERGACVAAACWALPLRCKVRPASLEAARSLLPGRRPTEVVEQRRHAGVCYDVEIRGHSTCSC
jgi:hypothetical protein